MSCLSLVARRESNPLRFRHPCGRCGWAILTDRQQPKQINMIL